MGDTSKTRRFDKDGRNEQGLYGGLDIFRGGQGGVSRTVTLHQSAMSVAIQKYSLNRFMMVLNRKLPKYDESKWESFEHYVFSMRLIETVDFVKKKYHKYGANLYWSVAKKLFEMKIDKISKKITYIQPTWNKFKKHVANMAKYKENTKNRMEMIPYNLFGCGGCSKSFKTANQINNHVKLPGHFAMPHFRVYDIGDPVNVFCEDEVNYVEYKNATAIMKKFGFDCYLEPFEKKRYRFSGKAVLRAMQHNQSKIKFAHNITKIVKFNYAETVKEANKENEETSNNQ